MESLTLWLTTALLVAVAALVLTIWFAAGLYRRMDTLRASNQSLSTRYGQVAEQFLPFFHDYPYDPANFRFIGSPIDGLQFEEDRIVFLEFKTGKATLTERQKHIRTLVEKRKVEFEEIRIG